MHAKLIIAIPSLIVVAVPPGPVPGTCVVLAPEPVVGPVDDFDEPVELAVHPATSATAIAPAATIRRFLRPCSRTRMPDPLRVERRELYDSRRAGEPRASRPRPDRTGPTASYAVDQTTTRTGS